MRLITPWLDNSCQIKPKRATTTFSQTFRELNTPLAAYDGLDVLPFSWPFDDLAVAVHDNMLKMARDDQQKLLLLDPNTHFNGNKDKFAVTNEFSDGHQRVEPLSQWGTNGFSSGKFRVQGNCLMLDTRPSGKRGDSNAWLFAIKGARSLSEKMLPDCGFSYRNQTDMVEKIIYFLTSLSITRPWDPGVLTSFCASQHKDNYFQQCFQIVVRLPSIWTWISDMHQFNISFVSLHALEELLLTGVHCSHLKLMESLLIVKIAGWVFDRVITCLWRVGIHDYDWLFILCFRIVYKSSALQLLLVLMPQKRNESTISLINVKYKKRLVIFSWVQPMAGDLEV